MTSTEFADSASAPRVSAGTPGPVPPGPGVLSLRCCAAAEGRCDDHRSPVCVCDEPDPKPGVGSCLRCGLLCQVSPRLAAGFAEVRAAWRKFLFSDCDLPTRGASEAAGPTAGSRGSPPLAGVEGPQTSAPAGDYEETR